MTPHLIVIAGPANTGKMPLARDLMERNPQLVCVHRDTIRDSLIAKVDECVITRIMGDTARQLIRAGYPVIAVAWNMEQIDRLMWEWIAADAGVPVLWLDVRHPNVAAMIPPMPVDVA